MFPPTALKLGTKGRNTPWWKGSLCKGRSWESIQTLLPPDSQSSFTQQQELCLECFSSYWKCSKLFNCHALRLHFRMKKVAKTGQTETLPQSHTTAGEVKLLQLLWCAQQFLPRRYSWEDRGGNTGKLSYCLENVFPIQVSGYTLLHNSTTTQDAVKSHSDPDWSN